MGRCCPPIVASHRLAVRSIDFDAVTIDVFTIEQSAAGVAAAKFLVDERNYVNVGRLSADVVLGRFC